MPYRTFIVSRFWRLLPTFVIVGAITVIIEWALGEWRGISWHGALSSLVVLGYGSAPGHHYVVPAWSLDVEFQFYLLAPLLLAAISARPKWAWPALTAIGAVGAVTIASQFAFADYAVPSYIGFFAIGIAAARMDWQPSGRLAIAAGSLALAFTVALAACPVTRGIVIGGHAVDPLLYRFNTAFCELLAAIVAPLALWTVRRESTALDRSAGDLSYVVYLLHWEAVVVVSRYWGHLSPAYRLPYVATAIVIVYLVSWLIWLAWDRPINAWRQRQMERFSHSSDAIPTFSTRRS